MCVDDMHKNINEKIVLGRIHYEKEKENFMYAIRYGWSYIEISF